MLSLHAKGQDGFVKRFFKLRYPEKIWVLSHPFIALKATKTSSEAQKNANQLINDPILDGDYNGGQVDAFRHAFWMATLTLQFGEKKARNLGIAHEKGNRIDFLKLTHEEGTIPDSISSAMDLKNNEIGIKIALSNPHITIDELKQLIIEKILNGELWIINKDNHGNYLDWENNVIDLAKWKGKWYNPKILIPSNQRKNSNK